MQVRMLDGGRTEDQNKKDMCIRLFHLPSSSLPSSIFHLVRFGSCKVWAHMCRNAWRLPGRWKMEDGRLEDGRWKTERAGSLLLFPARLLRYTVDTHSLHVSLRTYVGRDEKKSARTTRLPSSVFHSSVFHLPLSVSPSSTVHTCSLRPSNHDREGMYMSPGSVRTRERHRAWGRDDAPRSVSLSTCARGTFLMLTRTNRARRLTLPGAT